MKSAIEKVFSRHNFVPLLAEGEAAPVAAALLGCGHAGATVGNVCRIAGGGAPVRHVQYGLWFCGVEGAQTS